ncbi:MAG: chromosome segregation protein ScpA [Planctomycetaceae bacterium]|nr:MAG: chromosome segregation protein ScpA [Planctomycetaceae bacterium]
MADYRVNLEIFAGPLDLLLYLVRKEEVDIYDIPIAKITNQYIRYIELLKSLDIDLAGDFLVMAATLMQIKSAMLLPKAEPDQFQDDDLSDPRRELIRQLLEYKKFKDAANLLNAAANEQKERFPRPGTIVEQLKPDAEPEIDIEQVSIWDLLEAFDTICRATGTVRDISSIKDDTPIDLYQIEILHRLQTEGPMTFERIFESRTNRIVMIGLFLALLELIREKLAWVEQASDSSIYVRSLTEEPAEQAVQKAILTTEVGSEKSDQAEQQKRLPIAISELPPKRETSVSLEAQQQQSSTIPIAELPLKSDSTISPQEQENKEPAKDHKHQTAG